MCVNCVPLEQHCDVTEIKKEKVWTAPSGPRTSGCHGLQTTVILIQEKHNNHRTRENISNWIHNIHAFLDIVWIHVSDIWYHWEAERDPGEENHTSPPSHKTPLKKGWSFLHSAESVKKKKKRNPGPGPGPDLSCMLYCVAEHVSISTWFKPRTSLSLCKVPVASCWCLCL